MISVSARMVVIGCVLDGIGSHSGDNRNRNRENRRVVRMAPRKIDIQVVRFE